MTERSEKIPLLLLLSLCACTHATTRISLKIIENDLSSTGFFFLHFGLTSKGNWRCDNIFICFSLDNLVHFRMGNKLEKKNRFDQTVIDKLIDDTGLEREVIIAWR